MTMSMTMKQPHQWLGLSSSSFYNSHSASIGFLFKKTRLVLVLALYLK